MTRQIQLPSLIAGFAVLAGTAAANPSSSERAIELGQYSPTCKQFQAVPTDSRSELLPFALRLSMASCRQALVYLPVSDAEGLRPMVAGIEHALAPSIAIYRDVGAHGPAEMQILAAYGLGMTYINIAVRARSSIVEPGGPVRATDPSTMTDADLARVEDLLRLHDALEPMLAQDIASARDAFDQAVALAKQYPDAANADQVVTRVVADSENLASLLR